MYNLREINLFGGLLVASLSNRLLMFPREIPSFLSTAYSIRFPEKHGSEGVFRKIQRVFSQCLQLVKEILGVRPSREMFARNIERLENSFEDIRGRIQSSSKPICCFMVAPYDDNGAILGDNSYYYHHYKIRNFEKHFSVAPFLVRSAQDMTEILKNLRREFSDREIQVLNITAHGWAQGLYIPKEPLKEGSKGLPYDIDAVENDQFRDCAKDATIILDVCSAGRGPASIAAKIAKMNPGKTVFAPQRSLFFSKPIVKVHQGKVRIEQVVHGFAIFKAYVSGKFLF